MRDVANLAGVSTATVSHYINNTRRLTAETRARVERAIAQTGFVPNQAGRLLAQQKSSARSSSNEQAAFHTRSKRQKDSGNNHASSRKSSSSKQSDEAHETPLGSATSLISSNTTRLLLKIVRAVQPISRADLARRLGVNRSTVTDIVRPLLDSGVLREGAPEQTGVGRTGRPPIGLSLRANKAVFIGVNIGVRRSQVGTAPADGDITAEESFDTPSDPDETLDLIRAAIERLCAHVSEDQEVYVGVSVPGPTDHDGTRMLYAPHLGWRDLLVADALRTVKIGPRKMVREIPVIVENDATAAATYEQRRRLSSGAADEMWSDFILVRAGTGIGVGLVRGGEVYRGYGVGGGIAGEFGHMTIVAGGKECACGNRGCWERYASARSAAALYAGDRAPVKSAPPLRFMDVVGRAEAGERRAQSTLARAGEYLGIGIGNVISGLGVPRVVVSGRIVYAWKFIEEPLKQMVAKTMAGQLAKWSVEPGEPTGSGLGGALEVAIEHYITTITDSAK